MPRWVWGCAALAALASLASIGYRYRAEQRNRAVTIVAEAETIQELGAAVDLPLNASLYSLKQEGLGGVVISEQFVSDLLLVGSVTMTSGENPGSPYLVTLQGPASTLDRVERGVVVRFGEGAAMRAAPDRLIVHRVAPMTVRNLAIGLNPYVAQAVRDAGLAIVARASNPAGAGAETVRETVRWMKELGASYFLPQGEQVLGRRDNLDVLEETLAQTGIRYCTPEFVKIGGDANVVAAAPENVVRLHSAQAAELDKLPLSEAVDRYVRAARERNMRMLLLRPLTYSAQQPIRSFGDFMAAIGVDLRKQGGDLGVSRPFEEPAPPRPLLWLIGLAVAPVAMWVGTLFVSDPRGRKVGYVVLGLLGIACWVDAGRSWMALVGAVTFPTLAYAAMLSRQSKSWVVEYLAMTATSLVGGLVVAGMLNGLPYLVRADQFSGVKAAHFLPIGLIGWLLFRKLADPKEALGGTIRWSQALLTLAALAALALMATRTGNDNPAAVSGLEIKFRSVLDALLFVRPRTKEFLVGHPLLILGLALWIRERAAGAKGNAAGWAAVALVAGSIGQTSVVNTLCHLHTPVALSLARIGVGFLAGGILGAILWALVARVFTRPGS
ncbi:MAG: DUF5693 family protein [Fimbriimonadaceae bacterium]|nr:hypothetical protein [Chthonomonadaceae bacterium]MCO5296381.1 DUF5693 family protein [Fimbriimonadaceae bacterium]